MADYVSIHTGAQIDAAVSDVENKLNKSDVINDYTSGGADKAASAETVKNLKTQTDQLSTNTVKTTGNQAIAGNKTFQNDVVINGSFAIESGKSAKQPNDAVADDDIANLKSVKNYALSGNTAGDGLSYSDATKKLAVRLDTGFKFTVADKSISYDYSTIINKVNPEANDTVLVFNPVTALHRRINLTNIGVRSFNGRTGSVVPTSGDYSDSLIAYSRLDANKKSIQASSDTVADAINDLDDLKASKTEMTTAITAATTTLNNNIAAAVAPKADKADPVFTGKIGHDKGSATQPVLYDSANTDTGLYYTSDSANVTIDGTTELTVKRNEVLAKRSFKLGSSTTFVDITYTSAGLTVVPTVSGVAGTNVLSYETATSAWKFAGPVKVQPPVAADEPTTKQYVDDAIAVAASPVPPASVNMTANTSTDILSTTAFHPRSAIALVHYYDNVTNNVLVCSLYMVRTTNGSFTVSEKNVEKTYGTAPITFSASYASGAFKITGTSTSSNAIILKAKIVSVQE